jgi:two-component system OmpR family response regulator
MKALVIDDEADIRAIARLSLARVGNMDVVEAAGGEEGLRMAAAEGPDVILLDMMMPGMDGPTTFAALRAAAATAQIPVIFLTAKAMRSEVERLTAMGARGVLTKPFDPMTLAAQVRAILDA